MGEDDEGQDELVGCRGENQVAGQALERRRRELGDRESRERRGVNALSKKSTCSSAAPSPLFNSLQSAVPDSPLLQHSPTSPDPPPPTRERTTASRFRALQPAPPNALSSAVVVSLASAGGAAKIYCVNGGGQSNKNASAWLEAKLGNTRKRRGGQGGRSEEHTSELQSQ